ncbi:MAG: 30S ribosomal protein S5 [Candidatus Omnitrophica bacterium]|nr:30S ribosomal protein S5 [Candidatus Omnitrophota bacterium]MCM8798078.1 30S ribosomal protein S5 [Candidatus Omnitrophota bacterium]
MEKKIDTPEPEFQERVIKINRVAKVHKGGKKLSFSALVVVGNGKGKVGVGFGKANEVADAIRKAINSAHKNIFPVLLKGGTIPHEVYGHFGAADVLLKPAGPGTGIIAGSSVRPICELAGIKDILAKSLGSKNAMNIAKATIIALQKIKTLSPEGNENS